MQKVLVTGATGNIGTEVISYLADKPLQTFAAVRNLERAQQGFKFFPSLKFRRFDFEKSETYGNAFQNIDILFLLRPPQISNVTSIFQPLLSAANDNGITKIVFVSVQGAEKSKMIPHHKIEDLILSMDFEYIFIRPSYFMQNLTTTLLPEIRKDRNITLPAGKAKFNWIDVKNIGEAATSLLSDFNTFKNQIFEITGSENKNFKEVAHLMTIVLTEPITYTSMNPIGFYFKKRREGLDSAFALAMDLIHFLQRFQGEPKISNTYTTLTGKNPSTLKQFLERERSTFKN